MADIIDLSTDLLPYERAASDGAWCDIKHPASGAHLGRVKMRSLRCLEVDLAIHDNIKAGMAPIDATRKAIAEFGAVESEGISIRGELVCNKRHLLREMVTDYTSIYTQLLVFASNQDNYDAGESREPVIGPDAQDSPTPEG